MQWTNAASGGHMRNPGQDVSEKSVMYGHSTLGHTKSEYQTQNEGPKINRATT